MIIAERRQRSRGNIPAIMSQIGLGRAGGGGIGVPDWVLSGANVDMDFVNGSYWGGTLSGMVSVARASAGYAQATGGTFTSFGNNVLRITDQGLLIEESRTNVVLWNRDLTNVAWVKPNVTAALNQIGIDGAANSASSLTSTLANGTVLQSITLGSSARFQSVYMKRITGSGNVDMTMDNGATWTTVSGSINTSTYTRVTIPTQTLANPIVGFRIVTSGDAVAVDFVQNEDSGSFGTSPIATTTAAVTRAADNVTTAGMLNTVIAAAQGSLLAVTNRGEAAGITGDVVDSNGTIHLGFTSGNVATTQIGATLSTGGAANRTTRDRIFVGWDASGRGLVMNNGAVATDAQAVTPSATQHIGSTGAASFIDSYLERLTGWNYRLQNGNGKALTS